MSATNPITKSGFHVNDYYERLKRMRVENPKAFSVLSPAEKLSLAAYERARATVEPQTPTDAHKTRHMRRPITKGKIER